MTTLDEFLDDVRSREDLPAQTTTLLPDPEPRERLHTIISVDDHLIEPRDMFEGRLSSTYQEDAPYILERAGGEYWVFEGEVIPNVGFNAVAGRPPEEWSMEPTRFVDMRRGCWNVHQRIRDMDIDGVSASVTFPSFLAGFAGTRFSKAKDQNLGFEVLKAWNNWHLEAWAGLYPDRLIPCQIPWLSDPNVAADQVRMNAERGFKAVSFSENPEGQGLPSMHTQHWYPFLKACEETETVVCLHIGSSTKIPQTSRDAPPICVPTSLLVNAYHAAADWIWAAVPLHFPKLKIAMSEGGVSWVMSLYDRLNYVFKRHAVWALPVDQRQLWSKAEISPAEALLRNFWFCTFDDPSGIKNLDIIGAENVMLESDYPHSDGTWPDTQAAAQALAQGLSEADTNRVTHENASKLFRHPVPCSC